VQAENQLANSFADDDLMIWIVDGKNSATVPLVRPARHVRRSHRQSGEFGEDGRVAQAKAAQERRQAKKNRSEAEETKRKWYSGRSERRSRTKNGNRIWTFRCGAINKPAQAQTAQQTTKSEHMTQSERKC